MQHCLSRGALALLLTVSFGAVAAGHSPRQEASTAHAHALMASSADSLKMTHMHLHHVINCLVGPDGSAFDGDAGNPCKDMGNGALPDSQNNAPLHAELKKALAKAKSGVKNDDLNAAHQTATNVAQLLQTNSGDQ